MMHARVLCGTTNDLIAAIKELRCRCWRLFFTNVEFLDDGHDEHAMHFLVLVKRRVIAAARLCVHTSLQNITECHLYPTLDTSKFPGPYGCFNRLVVDAQFRGRGIAAILDRIRTDTTERLGCRTVLASWNHHSGDRRRQSLRAQGFTNVSNDRPIPDGAFGMSFPYAKRTRVTQFGPAAELPVGDLCAITGELNVLLLEARSFQPAGTKMRLLPHGRDARLARQF
jgi:GNAT superfamily N-acetyltransferase